MDDKKLANVKKGLKRVFSMPITRSTFRELQNALIATTEGDRDMANTVLESLMVGESKSGGGLRTIIDEFSVQAQLSRDVFEKGEFINMITSDILTQPGNVVFSNRIRRVDGEEFHFITDIESTVQLLVHFIGRLQELEKTEPTKEILNNAKAQLATVKARFDQLVAV